MERLPWKARLYVLPIFGWGVACMWDGISQWHSDNPKRFLAYLTMALIASVLKVNLPAVTGTMSVNFLFVLIGVTEMSLGETLAIGCLGTLFQCLWRPKARARAVQVLFSIATMAIAAHAAYLAYHWPPIGWLNEGGPILLLVAALVFFIVNTGTVAAVISLTEKRPLGRTWHNCYMWSFPFYLVGASVAWVISVSSAEIHWRGAILALPIVYFMHRSYRVYLGRLDDEKKHAEDMATLHLRTIEALALAIEAKDHTTHEHLQRVRTYAIEIGKEMDLSDAELEGLRAAALLHDIGKLAVPEHIISKPGRLSPEEFEKMKIHPVVGAEILERVSFPYPVVPIVRAHHERWNGSGYPLGLKGEEIPVGARILAAVDCLDAIAADRQYRRALPLDKAMDHLVSESGTSFDPRVIDILKHRYIELERKARLQPPDKPKLSTGLKVERGAAPAAGFEHAMPAAAKKGDFLASIAAARQEVHLLFELTRELGNSLSVDETLSVVATRLKRMIPYDSIAIYIRRDNRLVPEYVNGENFRLFSSLEIPLAEGLSGWVAENRKPILNGNPTVESGYLNDPNKFSTLRSALAVPLEGLNGVVGVLTMYRAERDAFTTDNLRILLAISAKISLSIENAQRFHQAQNSATTDYLTGLPNARSLFVQLDSEIARCKRNNLPLTLLVCDLDSFKQINDLYGHLEGNKVLRQVAAALRQGCREYDYVARMGGDEFVILLPGSDREHIHQRIAQLRETVSLAGWPASGAGLLSVSIGGSFYPDDGIDAEQLLAEADRRMYKHKQIVRAQLEPGGDAEAAVSGALVQ